MSRLIKTQNVGTERTRLTKSIVVALRELMKQARPDGLSKDLAAYIALALRAVEETIERTVIPWEKRNYWVKADKFRMDWRWVNLLETQLTEALVAEDWQEIAMIGVQIGSKLSNIKVSEKHRLGAPWVGAWKQFLKEESEKK